MTQHFSHPTSLLMRAQALLPWATGTAAIFGLSGLLLALVFSPADYQQGESVRIMYVHDKGDCPGWHGIYDD
jgi:heme exporter protein C